MGINLEYVTLLSDLYSRKLLPKQGSLLEFGAQDISANTRVIADHVRRCGLDHALNTINKASILYNLYGLTGYTCIDATGEHEALTYDLNVDLRANYGFDRKFDVVTNLGTFEHCFNLSSAFQNAHEACKIGGLIIHALPSNCNANHGYYTIQPRMLSDLAEANSYDIISFSFTVDYSPVLYRYSLDNYKVYDDRDLMTYIILQKRTDAEFSLPFDSIFSDKNTLSRYKQLYPSEQFLSYIKGSWKNIKPASISEVPTMVQLSPPRHRRWIKHLVDRVGGWL